MTDATSRVDQTTAYLEGLYGTDPQGLLWIGGHADGWRGRTFRVPREAATYALALDQRGGAGVYHRSTTLAGVPERRGEAADSQAVYYFALDVDIKGPGHKADNLPETLDDVERLIQLAGFPSPTLWVASGGGYYPQWRLHRPLDVRGPEDLEWVTETFSALAAHFIQVAGQEGWHLDNVRDLARVFRLPGTTNRKVEGQETLCEVTGREGERHDLGTLAGIVRRLRPRGSAPTAAPDPQPVDNAVEDLYEPAGRIFTRTQATDFIKAARRRLAAAEPGGYNVAINNFAITCSHFPWLIDQERCGKEVIRALGAKTGWTEPDAADRATIASAYRASSWVAQEVQETAAPSRGAEGASEILPPPSDPLAVARALAGGRADLTWWRDDFYQHRGTHWEKWELAEVRRWLYDRTGDAIWFKPGKEGPEPTRWAPTRKRVADLIEAMGEGLLSRFGQEDQCMALGNGVLDPNTRALAEHTPARFNLSALSFAYDPAARAPEWEKFLHSSLPNDREAHEFLGEWFGYVLSGRTDLQKIGALIGPRRCGKGTMARILEAMVGPDGWCAPTIAKLSGSFGLESMIGKSLAVMGDVRWTSKYVMDAVPVLLGVSGEDGQNVERKHQKDWVGKLGTRIMLMSNDSPTFTDASGALAGRMVYAAFEHSFYGREDLELEGRLMAELPGILNWALDGLDRLNRNGGRFTQSSRSLALREEVDRDSSPVAAWVDDRCVLDPSAEFTLDALLQSYRHWLTAENLHFSPSLNRLSRDLRAAFGDKGVSIVRKRLGAGGQHRVVTGLRPIVGGSISEDTPFD